MPSLLALASRELVPSNSLNVNGKAGNLVLMSLNTALEACVAGKNVRCSESSLTS